jgi:hypothetical protein
MTAPIAPIAIARARALPFIEGQRSSPMARSDARAAPQSAVADSLLTGTMTVPQEAIAAAATRGALPFKRDARPEGAPALRAEKAAVLAGKEAAQRPERAAPAEGPAARPEAALTLAEYASLCAELAVFPQMSEQIFQRYGLAVVRERLAVDLGWQERLRRSASEYQEWNRLYQHYFARWSEKGR